MNFEKDTALECLAWTCSLFKYPHLEVTVKGAALEEVRGVALNNISDQTSSTPAEQSSRKITHWAQVWHWNPKPVWIQRHMIILKNDVIHLLTTLQIFLLSAILRSSDPKIPSKSSHQCVMYYKTGWWTCKRHKSVIIEVSRHWFHACGSRRSGRTHDILLICIQERKIISASLIVSADCQQ